MASDATRELRETLDERGIPWMHGLTSDDITMWVVHGMTFSFCGDDVTSFQVAAPMGPSMALRVTDMLCRELGVE